MLEKQVGNLYLCIGQLLDVGKPREGGKTCARQLSLAEVSVLHNEHTLDLEVP